MAASICGGRSGRLVGFLQNDDPVRALLLIHVEALAVVAADALALDDLWPLDRAPLTRLLADLAVVALGPALDLKNGQVREDAEKRADRTEEPAVQVANDDRRQQQQAEHAPQQEGLCGART